MWTTYVYFSVTDMHSYGRRRADGALHARYGRQLAGDAAADLGALRYGAWTQTWYVLPLEAFGYTAGLPQKRRREKRYQI